tara:strand:+ start:289 stop:543 length:255 start_codon:yes stop_codon:yes gene_type:complete
MTHWIIEDSCGEPVRIEWNGQATFNLQSRIYGEWTDYHCFTCYGINDDVTALSFALEIYANEENRGTENYNLITPIIYTSDWKA